MKRVITVIVVLLGAGVLAVFATGASNGSGTPHYWVELDDAFGLVSGGDLKIAGVRAGTIGQMKVDQRTHRALVEIDITKNGFGSIRTDVSCQARPESLIGEYFLDCQPGTSRVELKPGSTIPVSRTSSVVAPDLVNDILRLPYRERFSIIINELGAAVAGNSQNLNDAIRRASPGLAQTDKVLAILAQQNHVLASLVKNADKVIGDMADNRAQVARWVVMAGRTSAASATRKADIARGFHELPGFLEQLHPAMTQLGNVATEQTPALRTLSQSAGNLKTFFDRLGPFATVSRPAFHALGQASVTGRKAVVAAAPTVAELNTFAKGAPELGKNLDIILRHLDSQKYSAEADPRSPGGKGYSGLQALLEYVYDQVLSVNIYDSSVHILKVSPFVSPCQDYADVAQALSAHGSGKLADTCAATLGPNSAGVNFPDTTRPDGLPAYGGLTDAQQNPFPTAAARSRRGKKGSSPASSSAPAGSGPATSTPTTPAAPPAATNPNVPTLSDIIPGAPSLEIPPPPKALQQATRDAQATRTQTKLLDYLLGA
jgi:virulence factor Mce-like protein